MFLNALYHVCIALIPSLGEAISQELFTRAAIGLCRQPLDLPGLIFPIRGIEAMVHSMGESIPPVAKAVFLGVKVSPDTGDVLIDYGFPPQLEHSKEGLDVNTDHDNNTRGRLSALMRKWNALSL